MLSKLSNKTTERQEEATVKRIKLEYDELSSCAREVIEVWDLLVSKESRVSTKCDNQMLLHAIKQGNENVSQPVFIFLKFGNFFTIYKFF